MAEAKLEFDKEVLTEKMLFEIGRVVKEKAIRMSPLDRGALRGHIFHKVVGDEVIIYTQGIKYADKMEYGAPPMKLSSNEKDDVEDWAHRHGLKSGRGVIKKLETKGIEVGTPQNPKHITSFGRNSFRPFLRPAAHQSQSEMKAVIRAVLEAK